VTNEASYINKMMDSVPNIYSLDEELIINEDDSEGNFSIKRQMF
jgi:hypothetical protein